MAIDAPEFEKKILCAEIKSMHVLNKHEKINNRLYTNGAARGRVPYGMGSKINFITVLLGFSEMLLLRRGAHMLSLVRTVKGFV